MPQKTKKQKMQADKRHVQPMSFQYQAVRAPILSSMQQENQTEILAIRGDIVKTIVLSIVAIGIEFALYFRFYR